MKKKNYQPHSGLEDKFLTSWDHRSAYRYDIPKRIQDACNSINNGGAFQNKKWGRPVTSHVQPLMINPRSLVKGTPLPNEDENGVENFTYSYDSLLESWMILEDWIYQYAPLAEKGHNERHYAISKLFNVEDITQWRMHHPALYVKELTDSGKVKVSTQFPQDALHLYVKKYEDDRKSNLYTINFNEAISEKDGAAPMLKERIYSGETYSKFVEFLGRNGIKFGAHLSQMNFSQFGYIRNEGTGIVAVMSSLKDEKTQSRFRFLKNMIEFGIEYSKRIMTTNGKKIDFARARNTEPGSYGEEKYIHLITEEETKFHSEITTGKNGKIYRKIKHNGEVYYQELLTVEDINKT